MLTRSPVFPNTRYSIVISFEDYGERTSDANVSFVILTKRATRAAGNGFWPPDSFARTKPVPVLKSRGGQIALRGAVELGAQARREIGGGSLVFEIYEDLSGAIRGQAIKIFHPYIQAGV